MKMEEIKKCKNTVSKSLKFFSRKIRQHQL